MCFFRKKKKVKYENTGFENISIRGRVAYGICCLENALEHYNLHGEGWNILLRNLWWYTELLADQDPEINNCYPLERWWALIGKILPMFHESKGWDYMEMKSRLLCAEDMPTLEELSLLQESYKYTNAVINKIVESIYDIGCCELWCGIMDYSPDSIGYLMIIVNLMKENNIPLPDIDPFKKYVFRKSDWDYDLIGFGEMFDGTQYSKFVDTCGPSKK